MSELQNRIIENDNIKIVLHDVPLSINEIIYLDSLKYKCESKKTEDYLEPYENYYNSFINYIN